MNIIQTMYRLESRMTVLFRTLIIGLIILIPSGLWTEYLFAKVNYPNAGFGGPQATFDVQERRNEYSILAEQETLDLFRQVQYVDFGIVVGTFIVFATLLLILAKWHPPQSIGRRLGKLGAVIISLGPLMDFCENITLLFILQNPLEYPASLGVANLLFTAGKTMFFILGWFVMAIVLLLLGIHKLRGLYR
ncbi:hypothetical protein ACF3MZ_24270 [Paenibacillaceae bacterium WGS1546]|uniref:hypothetical protein n=1 Tax=Cohnella sp. WGS1546 TaxID=3366810 RepID=UPI00372D881F